MKTLKNWWFTILAALVIVLDQGFDFINPVLLLLKVPENWIEAIKIILGLYVIVKQKLALPTQNIDKLKVMVSKKLEQKK